MSLAEEASRSIQGAWGLLRRDPAAPQAFNATEAGFWRSFAAAFVLLPLHLGFQSFVGPSPGTETVAPFTRWSVSGLVYAISWTLWPLIAFHLTRAMGCGERYLGYMVAYNWSQLITGLFTFGVGMLARAGLDAEGAAFATLLALAAALVYEYLIARQMLGVPPPRAALLVFAALLTVQILSLASEAALLLAAPEAS